jgi:hypothetical protein
MYFDLDSFWICYVICMLAFVVFFNCLFRVIDFFISCSESWLPVYDY